jgi:RHS repeat-associated protein
LTTNLKFCGQYLDSESGLYQLRARYYDPATAQFLTRDPLVAKTRSPYQYAMGTPLNATDPTGLDCGWTDPLACVSDVLGTTASATSAVITDVTGGSSSCANPLNWLGCGTNWVKQQANPGNWSYGACAIVCYQYNASDNTHQWGIGIAVDAGISGPDASLPNGGVCLGIKLTQWCNPNGVNGQHANPGNWKQTWGCGLGIQLPVYYGDEHKGAFPWSS